MNLNETILYLDKLSKPRNFEEKSKDKKNVKRTDQDFFRIGVKFYISGKKSQFDLFLRLNSDNYIKVLHQGDSFDLNFINNLSSKGVEYLYVELEFFEYYLKIQGEILKNAAIDQSLTLSTKTQIICSQGESIIETFKAKSNPISLQNAEYFIEGLKILQSDYKSRDKASFRHNYLNETMGYGHGISAVLIGNLIAGGLKITSDKTMRTISMACMFHDVGLLDYFPGLEHESTKKIPIHKLTEFYKHPQEGVKILAPFKEFDNQTLQAIRQHHMRQWGPSFPPMSSSEVISEVSMIVGMADEIAHAITATMGPFNIEKLPDLEIYLTKKVFPFFKKKFTDSVKETLFKKKTKLNEKI
jgi:hypothetical protein